MDAMQGFCWPLSAAAGEIITFRMSTGAERYALRFVRFENKPVELVSAETINKSQEFICVEMTEPVELPGHRRDPDCYPDTGCAHWGVDYTLTVPATWSSGIYAAQCVDAAKSVFYVTFVVKPTELTRCKLAALANTTTWAAYCTWGGYSRYEVDVPDRPYHLSLLRPNPEAAPIVIDERPFNDDIRAKAERVPFAHYVDGRFDEDSRHLARAELWVLSWLSQRGYSVDVYSDLDFHRGIKCLSDYKSIILTTHPEYWSKEMFSNLSRYLWGGGKLLYLGGNGLYECVEFPNKDLSVMKFQGTFDQSPRPFLFRVVTGSLSGVEQPEAALLGVQYPDAFNYESRAPYLVRAPEHRFFLGTDVMEGTLLGSEGWNIAVGASSLASGAASGWEVDRMANATPANCELLAEGANTDFSAHMTYFDHPGGGFVFSAGSITFGGSLVVDTRLQRLIKNILDECLNTTEVC